MKEEIEKELNLKIATVTEYFEEQKVLIIEKCNDLFGQLNADSLLGI